MTEIIEKELVYRVVGCAKKYIMNSDLLLISNILNWNGSDLFFKRKYILVFICVLFVLIRG